MKSRSFLFVLCAGFAAASFGQSLLGLTFPFGIPVQPNSGMSLSMGGAGCAVAAENNVMLLNPANLGSIDRTVLSALFSFDFTQISAQASHTNFYAANPVQISIGVPVGAVGTFGISLEQRDDRTSLFESETSFTYKNTSAIYGQGLSARGGMYSWQIGWGRSIRKVAQVGISYERFYLSAEQTILSELELASGTDTSGASNSRDSTHIGSSGNGVRAGIVVPVGSLRVGLTGEYFFNSSASFTRALYSYGDTASAVNSATSSSFNLRLPPSASLGLSYDFSPEWLVAADLSLVFWKYAQVQGMLPQPEVGTAAGFSLGAQYIPAPNLLTPRYWETIRYRAGVQISQLAAKDSYEYLVSLGTGLPMGRGTGILDIALEIGRRQSGQFSGYSEDFIRLAFGFNGGHKWVQSSKSTY